jgi:hypothetical protein
MVFMAGLFIGTLALASALTYLWMKAEEKRHEKNNK